MEIYFEDSMGRTLCFNHAVKAVMEKDEVITAHAPDTSINYDMGGSGYLGSVCVECYPPEPEEEIEE